MSITDILFWVIYGFCLAIAYSIGRIHGISMMSETALKCMRDARDAIAEAREAIEKDKEQK